MWVHGGLYEAWADYLDRWGGGEQLDPATLPKLAPEDLAGDTWERLVDRITAALSKRLTSWSDTLGRELSGATDEFAAARALGHARWSLAPVRAFAAGPALPDELRTRLIDLVDTQLRSTQRQLDDQVQRLLSTGTPRAAVEARLRTIRDNPLTAVTGGGAVVAGGGWDADPGATPRRRVILD
jgi:hypothetical protein